MDQSPASILITDPDGRIEYVNEKFTEITLFMSGYNDDVILHHNLRSADVDMLQKPFTAIILTTKVREVLDRPQGGAGPAETGETGETGE